MRILRSSVALLAALAMVWSVGVEFGHDHQALERSTLECAVDHERASSDERDAGERLSKAGQRHGHFCLACRTGRQRSLVAESLGSLPGGQLSDEALPGYGLVLAQSPVRSGPVPRGPPSV